MLFLRRCDATCLIALRPNKKRHYVSTKDECHIIRGEGMHKNWTRSTAKCNTYVNHTKKDTNCIFMFIIFLLINPTYSFPWDIQAITHTLDPLKLQHVWKEMTSPCVTVAHCISLLFCLLFQDHYTYPTITNLEIVRIYLGFKTTLFGMAN